jgi:predicted GIY-YIG superfamily endonuclease
MDFSSRLFHTNSMPQMLLFPDPRPLVERLGAGFFQNAPDRPGVYLMRDEADTVLYIGKAKSLRKRLASYRVANPDRMRRRHLRLLRAVSRIELQECPDETTALSRESELLRALKPRFNRAGTWTGPARYFGWRISGEGLELTVNDAKDEEWQFYARSLGAAAKPLRTVLVRLLWCANHPARGLAGLPTGWFRGRFGESAVIPRKDSTLADFDESERRLNDLFGGRADEFAEWIRQRSSPQATAFEIASREADLEAITEFAGRLKP